LLPRRAGTTIGMQLDDVAAILAKADFFELCDAEQRRLLAFVSEPKIFQKGQVIFSYGDEADGCYVLVSGELSAVDDAAGKGKPRSITEPGSLLGELGLVLARPRRSTLTAATRVEMLLVPRQAFLKLAVQFPELADKAAERIEQELNSFLNAIDTVRRKLHTDKGR